MASLEKVSARPYLILLEAEVLSMENFCKAWVSFVNSFGKLVNIGVITKVKAGSDNVPKTEASEFIETIGFVYRSQSINLKMFIWSTMQGHAGFSHS